MCSSPSTSSFPTRWLPPFCLFIALASLVVAASPARAQEQGTVTGQVLTPDGNSLPGATVRIAQSDEDGVDPLGDQTNANGNFRIEGVPAGEQELVASFVGYRTQRRDITVGPDTSPLTIRLEAQTLALEGLTVTSQKRIQEVQEIPAAVSSYEGDFLDDIGVQQFDRFSDFVPGLQVQIQSPNNPGFVVRGITSDDGDARVQPRVSVYQNGVSISKSRGSVVELYDLERVEVLKGPQGTLFGRAAQIGAVNIIQNRAENTQSLRLEGGIGNENERYVTGHANVPVVEDKLFLRVASLYNKRDGVVSNKTGDPLNGKETFASRGSMRWLPTDGTVVDVIANYQRDTPPGTSFKSGSFAPPEGTTDPSSAAAMGSDPVLEDDDLFLDRTVWDVTLLVDQALSSNLTLNSTTAYREFDSLERFDADGTAAPALQFDEDAEGKQFSQEVRVTYESTGRFSGFGGANFFWEDGSQRVPFRTDERSFIALLNSDIPLVGEDGQPTLVPSIPNPETGNSVELKDSHQEAYTNYGSTTAAEVFLDGTVDVTEALSVTAGLRGTFEDMTGEYKVTNSETPGRLGALTGASPNNLFEPTNGRLSESETFWSAVGRLAADYAITDDINSYVTLSRGRRPNVIDVNEEGANILDAETVWSYEGGIKGISLNDRLEYTLSGFAYDYSNFQTSVTELNDEGEFVSRQRDSGKASALGLETSVRAAVTEDITVFSNYAFIDATFDDTDEDGETQELAGNQFRLTPRHSISGGVNVDYSITPQVNAFLRPSVRYKSKVYFEEENNENISQDGYAVVDVRGGVTVRGIQIEGYVENVFDKEFIIDGGNTGAAFGTPTFIAGDPRFFGVRVSTSF
ncbi:TonB-dependent receptor [Salinibacter grassmerensis]|uniref:TonB-dependent receptor n=1 Tax=Salinibacter grassmerensis TaxID=3040353 RepID=UPI0021E7E474|nr:TonB-dependent receptor [Salinibacter grassmerensis]